MHAQRHARAIAHLIYRSLLPQENLRGTGVRFNEPVQAQKVKST